MTYSIDVNGFDNTPEWGTCKAPGCTEDAYPIWFSGGEPDDPDLLLCEAHIGARLLHEMTARKAWTAIGARAEADNAALRELVAYVEESIDWDNQAFSLAAQRIHARITGVLTAEYPGAALLAELEAARAVVEAVKTGDRGNIGDALYAYDKAMKVRQP